MPDPSLLEKLTRDMNDALRAGEKERLGVIRLLRAQLKDAAIRQGRELNGEEELAVLSSAAKMRQESIDTFTQGQRMDLVEKEQAELEVIRGYLPEPISDEDLSALVDRTLDELGVRGPGDLGKVMKSIMPRIRGRAPGGRVNALVREKLQRLS
jgi:uncharacterized protein YqeY